MESRFGGVVAWCVCVVAVGCFPPALPRPDADAETDDATDETSDAKDDTHAPETNVPLSPPGSVTATTDLDDRVVVSWEPSSAASGYRVFRCEGACEDTAIERWTSLVPVPISATSYPDETAATADAPTAPEVNTTLDRTDDVRITWAAVATPAAPRYAYRVVAVGVAGESEPSPSAIGHLSERPITGYEIEIDGEPWVAVAGTSYTDEAAGAATLSVGAVSASQGTFADRVELSLASFGAEPGAQRAYRVRAVTAYGAGEASEREVGWRVAGTPQVSWERSADSAPDGFAAIAGASQATFQDRELPADGVIRYYRARLTATGAAAVSSEAVAGWRQARPGVPQVTGASTELADRVEVRWEALSGASAYHVYRGEVRLTPEQGVTCTGSPCVFADGSAPAPGAWAAPSTVSATNDLTTGVRVTWTPPVRPVGASQSYRVSALNPGGESERSTAVQGWRAAPPLTGTQVRATTVGNEATHSLDLGEATFLHTAAPLASFAAATLGATRGDHRNFVRLMLQGGALGPAASVSYQVRGEITGGTYTPWSTAASGRRATGAVSRTWQYAATEAPAAWSALSTMACASDATSCEDTTASPLGERRWYRVALNAEGASPAASAAVDGWRLAFVGVAAGFDFSCAHTPIDPDDGRVWCWGANSVAQLGRGQTTTSPQTPLRIDNFSNVAQLALGSQHACARKTDGTVWCWGNQSDGQTGSGTIGGTPLASPTQVQGVAASKIAANAQTTCAVTTSATAICWGNGGSGQLGNNAENDSATPVIVRTSASNLAGVSNVDVGISHACAARTNGEVWCWGSNSQYELGRQTPSLSSLALQVPNMFANAVSAGWNFTCAHLASGGVQCWGENLAGGLGNGSTEQRVVTPQTVLLDGTTISALATTQVVSGGGHSCAVLANSTPPGKLACWGMNQHGQVGIGGSHIETLTAKQVSTLGVVSAQSVNGWHSCAIDTGAVHCWGYNADRQLGISTGNRYESPVPVVVP